MRTPIFLLPELLVRFPHFFAFRTNKLDVVALPDQAMRRCFIDPVASANSFRRMMLNPLSRRYTSAMSTPDLYLDCSSLNDDELETFWAFLESKPIVEEVGLGFLGTEEELPDSNPVCDDGGLNIQASAPPVILAIHIIKEHWPLIASVAGGVPTAAKTLDWLQQKVKAFNDSRSAMYDLRPIYGPDDKVYKMVKVPKKPHATP